MFPIVASTVRSWPDTQIAALRCVGRSQRTTPQNATMGQQRGKLVADAL
jgi:hypothetical protein